MRNNQLMARLEELKRERDAAVFAHNYQIPEVQDAADYIGDSLGLSRIAAETKADVILFCGVHFMAETASILSPNKKILVPDLNAGCPMADMVMPRELARWRDGNPGKVVVTYVNSSAAVKALSDICCTSANAVQVVESIPADKEILFVPDRNLGKFVMAKTGRRMELWLGFCPTHERMLVEQAERAKAMHPDALLLAHPECPADLLAIADYVSSTTGIIAYCHESPAREFIIATECGILHPLRRGNPDKIFHTFNPVADCPNMKLNTLQKMVWALEDMAPEVSVPKELADRARLPIQRMLEIG
ncbi:MAG: quinolinate synthase NadA [Planctomycetota bacterium]|jgi:quinolinate synthase|nr:quinolinate synthase NadA [Planctomycetota bacterium]